MFLKRTWEQPVPDPGEAAAESWERRVMLGKAGSRVCVIPIPRRKTAHTPVNNEPILIIDLPQSRGVSFQMFCFSADTLNFGGGLLNFRAWKSRARKSDWSCLRKAQQQNMTQFQQGMGLGT